MKKPDRGSSAAISVAVACVLAAALAMTLFANLRISELISEALDVASAPVTVRETAVTTAADLPEPGAVFASMNPFRTTGQAISGSAEDLGFSLRPSGIIDGVGAWFVNGSGSRFVLLNSEIIPGFILVRASGHSVTVRSMEGMFTMSVLWGESVRGETVQIPAAAPVPVLPPAAERGGGGFSASIRRGDDGWVISRETVTRLFENPFGEISKVRLIPMVDSSGSPAGVRVAGIAEDSLLRQIGVQRNDVIRGVNGQQLRSVSDMMNAAMSMIDGDHFEVEVLRGTKNVNLRYKVQ